MRPIGNVLSVFLAVWLMLGWTLSYAQDSFALEDPQIYLDPKIGTELVPRGSLDVWERHPSGLLRGKGNKVATIRPGETYTVTDKKVIAVLLFGDRYYIQIMPKDAQKS